MMMFFVIRKKEIDSAGMRSIWKTKKYFIFENV